MKTKDTEGNVKTCTNCKRDMNSNNCTTHSESISVQPCCYCHLQEAHIVPWDNKDNGEAVIGDGGKV
jgi:hypothetical protein